VLNDDTRTYGKHFMFDESEETCWNSDAGTEQWVLIRFKSRVRIGKVCKTKLFYALETRIDF